MQEVYGKNKQYSSTFNSLFTWKMNPPLMWNQCNLIHSKALLQHEFFNSKNNNAAIPCTADETKLWSSPSAKQRWNLCSGPPAVYQDLSTCHDWPVKNVIVDLPIKIKGNSKRFSCNSLSPLGVQDNDLVAASQTLITKVTWRLRRKLCTDSKICVLLLTFQLVFWKTRPV